MMKSSWHCRNMFSTPRLIAHSGFFCKQETRPYLKKTQACNHRGSSHHVSTSYLLIQTCSFVVRFYCTLHNIIAPVIQKVQLHTYCILHLNWKQKTASQAFLLLLFLFKTKVPITSLHWFLWCAHCNRIHKQQKCYFTQCHRVRFWCRSEPNARLLISLFDSHLTTPSTNFVHLSKRKKKNFISHHHLELNPRLLTHSSSACMRKQHKASNCLIHYQGLLKQWTLLFNTHTHTQTP